MDLPTAIARPYAVLDATFAPLAADAATGGGAGVSRERFCEWLRGAKASFASLLGSEEAIAQVSRARPAAGRRRPRTRGSALS
jgi:hypothetical protein